MAIRDYLEQIPKNLYTAVYNNSKEAIQIGEFVVPLPNKPAKNKFQNYGVPVKDQVFKRQYIPNDLRRWEKTYQKQFIDAMYHKRKNGEWWLINGKELYITGRAWTFFNFWNIEAGGLPKFRYEAVEFFLFFEMCWNDKNCFGMLDFKARRLGDTEKALFLGWDITSKYNNSHFGMQNKKKDDAEKNFQRVVKANKNMIWFFKPISGGMDSPKRELPFEYPPDFLSSKRMKAEKKGNNLENQQNFLTVKSLESLIDYEPTTLGAYDGQRLTYYHGDEWGKTTEINVKIQWGIIKPTLALDNMERIVGKALITTTVEEFDEGSISTIEVMEAIWKESDPALRDGNGRTISGLYRLFRSALLGAKVDSYGFTNDESTRTQIANTEQVLIATGALDDLAGHRRKFPLKIEDVFSVAPLQCVLYPAKLELRLRQLKDNLDHRNQPTNEDQTPVVAKAILGDLVWERQFGGNVVWQPHEKGKWCISQHPKNPNIRAASETGRPKPVHDHNYTFGCDPYDAGPTTSKKRSDGSGVVYRRLDIDIDGHLIDNNNWHIPESQTPYMETDQFICDYVAREDDPEDFYEDMLLTSIYYSVAMLCERDKPSCENYFRRKGYHHYIKKRPEETKSNYHGKNNNVAETGIKAAKPVIRMYVDALKVHVFHRIRNCHHMRLIADFRQFNIKNRTERDLTVAAGMALLSDMDERTKQLVDNLKEWGSPIFRKYE
jgi:hypothetical protein